MVGIEQNHLDQDIQTNLLHLLDLSVVFEVFLQDFFVFLLEFRNDELLDKNFVQFLMVEGLLLDPPLGLVVELEGSLLLDFQLLFQVLDFAHQGLLFVRKGFVLLVFAQQDVVLVSD